MFFRENTINKWLLLLAVALLIPNVIFLYQPFYQDEWPIVRNVITFIANKTISPYHAQYPTLYSYLVTPGIAVGAVLANVIGYGESVKETVGLLYFSKPHLLILPARIQSLVFLVSTAVVLFYFVKARYDLLSAVFVFSLTLTSPSLVQYGSYGLPDTAVLFFSTLALIFTFKSAESDEHISVKHIYYASIFAGLAISTKYNAVTTVVPIAFAVTYAFYIGKISLRGFISISFVSGLLCVLFFLLGSPGWVLNTEFFIEEFISVREHAKLGHLGQTGVPFLGQLELMVDNAGVLFLAASLGFCVWLRKINISGIIALVSFISIFILSGLSSKQSVHYLYPGYAGLLVLAAVFNMRLYGLGAKLRYGVTWVLILVAFGVSASNSVVYLNENTTQLATEWMKQNIPKNTKVTVDWGYVPTIYSDSKLEEIQTDYSKSVADELRQKHTPYTLVPLEYSSEWLNNAEAKYFITSDWVYNRFFEFGVFTRIKPKENDGIFLEFDRRKLFYTELFSSEKWTEVINFDSGNGPTTRIYKSNE